MLRAIAMAGILAAGSASAQSFDWKLVLRTGPSVAVSGARLAAPEETCRTSGPARIDFTFSDKDGIAYAAVHVGAVAVRPAVSERARTWLWLPAYARPNRAYRWAYEDEDASLTTKTIPVDVNLVAGAGPLEVFVIATDGAGELLDERISLRPVACG